MDMRASCPDCGHVWDLCSLDDYECPNCGKSLAQEEQEKESEDSQ